MKCQPGVTLALTWKKLRTVAGRQFDWGGRLLKGNGGVQRWVQAEWKPARECKGINPLDCKANAPSRDESRT